ncbi:hypothetical protein OROHE_021545 [Orobanche hederae]
MMSSTNILDLNLPIIEEEAHIYMLMKRYPTPYLILIKAAIEDFTDEDFLEENLENENLHQGQRESFVNIDLNQPPPTDSEADESADDRLSRSGKRELSNDERQLIHLALLKRSVNGKLRKGTIIEIAQKFSKSPRTISRIWMRVKNSSPNGQADVHHRKTKNCGRKRITIDREQFQKIPLSKRTTIRSTASVMEVSKSSLHRTFQSGDLRRHSNPLKSYLKESNKKARVEWCLSMIDKNSGDAPRFDNMFNVIHIDEKWFYISKKSEKYYLLPEECDPHRSCKSKIFLTKVMFLAATARPRFDSSGNEVFSGKIGIFPFITKQPAKRSSANRVAGTLETKPITSVGRDLSRDYLVNKVLPAILEKWPFDDRDMTIIIQQDNARTHIDPNDEEFRLAVAKYGLNVQIRCQPPNSPDLNVLDLGFFSAIQSLQQKEPTRTVDELISAVEKAFDMFSSTKANRVFLTLQLCMIEIMKCRGAINYKIPHMKKSSLERNGNLPLQLQCEAKLIEDVTNWLNAFEND